MKKCIIYGRQSSSASETFSESVEYQIEKCKELAIKDGYAIAGIFKDLNVSGKTYPAGSESIAMLDVAFQKWYKEQSSKKMYRSGLGDVFKTISNETIDYIIVYDITRLYRPISGSFLESHISQLLLMNNIKVLTVNNGLIDFNDFNDSLVMTLQNRINHEQISIQRKKSKAAIHNLQNDGAYYPGLSKVLGFKKAAGIREVMIDEDNAKMVKEVFNMAKNSHTINAILKHMNYTYRDNGNKTLLTRTSIKRILKNPIYAGYIYNKNGELIKSKQTNGFIDFSLWKEVNDIVATRKYKNRRDKKTWLPLSGYVFCGTCRTRLTVHSSSMAVKQYGCESHTKIVKERCYANINVSRNCVYGIGLIEAVYPLLSLAALKEIEVFNSQNSSRDKLNALKVELTNLMEREAKLSNMYIAGLLDENTLSTTLKTIAEKKKSLNIDIINYESMITTPNSIDNQIKIIKDIVNGVITKEEYEKLLHKSIKEIHVFKTHVNIKTFYGELTLTRQHLNNFRLLPHYFMNIDSNYNINLIYYYGKERKYPDVYESKDLIADWGKMKVYYLQ